MSPRVIKVLIGALSIILLASSLSHLTERHSTTPTRPLLLVGWRIDQPGEPDAPPFC
jgi:hypothetical protein